MEQILAEISDVIWGPAMLVAIIGTGIFLTIRLKFLPIRNLFYALKMILKKDSGNEGDLSPFQSLMTALAATVGTGNIVGVATAMVLGGPGALIWMWLAALVGLATKYSEAVLAVKYRETNSVGEMSGGPMFVMKKGIGGKFGKFLAVWYAFFIIFIALCSANMVQANSISSSLNLLYNLSEETTGIILVVLTMSALMRGVRSIGKIAEFFMPIMMGAYIFVTLAVIVVNFENLLDGLPLMFKMAFSPYAVAGGIGGSLVSSMLDSMRWGVARGVFSNESGAGTASIIAAAAQTDHPSRQGYVSMTGTCIDTMVICMLTGLAIASSGVLGVINPEAGKLVSGLPITIMSFATVFGESAKYVVSIALILCAYSTILAYEYYGEKGLEFLTDNRKMVYAYRLVYSLAAYVGATQTLELVWGLSEVLSGLIIPSNLICLWLLSGKVAESCFHYEKEILQKEKLGRSI